MKLRRCAVLMIEPREHLEFDLGVLFQGDAAFAARITWVALAPHLDGEVELSVEDLPILAHVGETLWMERDALPAEFDSARIAALLDTGILIGDLPAHAAHRLRDERTRAAHWRPLSAIGHVFSRWHGQRADIDPGTDRFKNVREMVEALGAPPPETISRASAAARIALPTAHSGALDLALFARYTGRNYDRAATLPTATAARLLQRTFGAQAHRELGPGAIALKKTSPSGGSLHPIEAYVLAQRVEGVATGLYHYHPLAHALEPVQALDAASASALALRFVAGQHWFADAPMLVVLAARVRRNFWKYRNHPKAYRAIVLDAGHLSQTFYLLAAEANMPAFITAAINEVDIEHALDLDPINDAVLAVLGCGEAANESSTVEFRSAT